MQYITLDLPTVSKLGMICFVKYWERILESGVVGALWKHKKKQAKYCYPLSLFLYPSLFLSISIFPYIYISIYISFSLSISLSIFLSLFTYIYIYIYRFLLQNQDIAVVRREETSSLKEVVRMLIKSLRVVITK